MLSSLQTTGLPGRTKFPFIASLVVTYGSQWTPGPSTRDHKKIWSGIHNHSGEHQPATAKLQHSPPHVEMYMNVK